MQNKQDYEQTEFGNGEATNNKDFPYQQVKAVSGSIIKGVIQGQEVSGNIINTGNHNQFFIGDYERLQDAYIEPWPVFDRVKLEYFVGRQWLIAKVDTFLQTNDRGYFILEAEAGLGKTTFLAWLVQERKYIHHFIELTPGPEGLVAGLKNLVTQLIVTYQLNPQEAKDILPHAAVRPDYLFSLLRKASEQRPIGEKIVLVIDALDEAGTPLVQSTLGLSRVLPEGVYFIVSHRPGTVSLNADVANTPRHIFTLTADSHQNLADMKSFLERAATWSGIGRALAEAEYTAEQFATTLLEKCQGVWIYLHYIIYEIERGERSPLNLKNLPNGLVQYYFSYWTRWRNEDEEKWDEIYLPLLTTIAAAQEAVSVESLIEWTKIKISIHRIRKLLNEKWRPFMMVIGQGDQTFYRFYHVTLQEFFAGQMNQIEIPTAELALNSELTRSTQDAHSRLAEYYLTVWGGLDMGLPNVDIFQRNKSEGYGFRHLAFHLDASGRIDELHRLLALETKTAKRNLWYAIKESSVDISSYLTDLHMAWRRANDPSILAVGLQIRYALIESSIHSVAGNIPPELLVYLVRQDMWSLDQALAFVQQMEENDRDKVLNELVIVMAQKSQCADALIITRKIRGDYDRAAALDALLPYLPYEHLGEVISEGLKIVKKMGSQLPPNVWFVDNFVAYRLALSTIDVEQSIKFEDENTDFLEEAPEYFSTLESWHKVIVHAFIKLLLHSPFERREQIAAELLLEFHQIEGETNRATLLSILAPHLPNDQITNALKLVRTIKGEIERAQALVGLAEFLPPNLLTEAIELAEEIQQEFAWALALIELATHVREDPIRQQILMEVFNRTQDRWSWGEVNFFLMILNELAPALAQAGLYTQALETAKGIFDINESSLSLANTLVKIVPLLPKDTLPHAFTLIQETKNEWDYSHALEIIAPHLSPPLLIKALQSAYKLQDERACTIALAGLVPYLSTHQGELVLDEVLASAHTVPIERLITLAERLSGSQQQKVLYKALAVYKQIRDFDAYVSILAKLSPYLPSAWSQDILNSAQKINDVCDRTHILVSLFQNISEVQKDELISEIIELLTADSNEDRCASTLATLAPYLTPTLLDQALQIAENLPIKGILGGSPKIEAIVGLAPILTKERRDFLLAQLLSTIHDPIILLKLAPYFSSEQRDKLLKDIQVLAGQYQCAEALAELAPHLTLSQLLTALEMAKELPECERIPGQLLQISLENKEVSNILGVLSSYDQILGPECYPRIRALTGVIPYLPAEQRNEYIPEVLKMIQFLDYEDRVHALLTLAPCLPAGLKHDKLTEILLLIPHIKDELDQAKAHVFLANQLLPEDEPNLLVDAVKMARQIQFIGSVDTDFQEILSREDIARPPALAALAIPWSELVQTNRSTAYELWVETLQLLAVRHRALLMNDLQALIPVIIALGGKKAAEETAQAIQDVKRWWP